MGGRTKRLGDAELEIMQVIWSSEEPVRSTYVQQQLKNRRDWPLPAVATALNRWWRRGICCVKRRGGATCTALWCPRRTIRRRRAAASSTASTATPSPEWWPPCTGQGHQPVGSCGAAGLFGYAGTGGGVDMELLLNLLKVSLVAGGATVLLTLLKPLLQRRFHAKWRYWVWLCLAALLLTPLLPSLPLSLPAERAPIQVEVPALSVTYETGAGWASAPSPPRPLSCRRWRRRPPAGRRLPPPTSGSPPLPPPGCGRPPPSRWRRCCWPCGRQGPLFSFSGSWREL